MSSYGLNKIGKENRHRAFRNFSNESALPRAREKYVFMNKDKIILHLCCSKLASDSKIYKENGYDVRTIGLDFGYDVQTYEPPRNVYGIIANPPCTMFSIARTAAKTPRNLKKGMETVIACLRIIWECQYKLNRDQRKPNLKFWMLENPATGFLRWFLGNPVFTFQPYEFGENYSKKTSLWGMFNLPKKPLLYNPIQKNRTIGKPSQKEFFKNCSSTERSRCCYPFSQAFFEENQ